MKIQRTFFNGLDPERLESALERGEVRRSELQRLASFGTGPGYHETLTKVAAAAGVPVDVLRQDSIAQGLPPDTLLAKYLFPMSFLARQVLGDTFTPADPLPGESLNVAEFAAAVDAGKLTRADLEVLARGDWDDAFMAALHRVAQHSPSLGLTTPLLRFDRQAVKLARSALESSGPMAEPTRAAAHALSGQAASRPAPVPAGNLRWETD